MNRNNSMLVKDRIDRYALRDALDNSNIPKNVRKMLSSRFNSIEHLDNVIKLFTNLIPTGGDDDLIIGELREIRKDLKWSGTRRGKLIIEINHVVPKLYKRLRRAERFPGLLIGAHAAKFGVVITGTLPTADDKSEVFRLVKSSLSYPIVDLVKISSEESQINKHNA